MTEISDIENFIEDHQAAYKIFLKKKKRRRTSSKRLNVFPVRLGVG